MGMRRKSSPIGRAELLTALNNNVSEIGRSKKLWLDGYVKLKNVLSGKEMSDLQEVMRDKELNVRTDIYEILLQDDEGP